MKMDGIKSFRKLAEIGRKETTLLDLKSRNHRLLT